MAAGIGRALIIVAIPSFVACGPANTLPPPELPPPQATSASSASPASPPLSPPSSAPQASSIGASSWCEPRVFSDCKAGVQALSVAAALEQKPTGKITVTGVVERTETRCTRSEPPSCTSSLALTDQQGGKGPRLLLHAHPGSPSYSCGDPGCCSLPTDETRFAAVGVLTSGPPAALVVESVCRLP